MGTTKARASALILLNLCALGPHKIGAVGFFFVYNFTARFMCMCAHLVRVVYDPLKMP